MGNDEFSAEIEDLWQCGSEMLPEMAALFGEANQEVHRTERSETQMFKTRVYGPWTALRDELQVILKTNRDNLNDTGEALCMLAEAYAEDDRYASQEVTDALNDAKDDYPGPSYVPEGREPGDDHPEDWTPTEPGQSGL